MEPKKVWRLRHLDLFASMSDEQIEEIAALFDDHRLPAGAELLGCRRRDQIYLIKEGVVRISIGEGRDAAIVALLGPGRMFGLSSVVGDDAEAIQAVTIVPSSVCVATWSKLIAVLSRSPLVLMGIMRSMARQVVQVERWRERFGMTSPRERLADLLRELADEFGEPAADGRRIMIRLTRADLAMMIGAARETTSRAMAEFERAGWIRSGDGFLIVTSEAGLTEDGA